MIDLLKLAVGFAFGAFIAPFVKPWTRWIERLGRKLFVETPVAVNLETDQSVIWAGDPPWVGFRCYFPDGMPEEDAPDAAVDWHEWAARNGGIDFGLTIARLTIQAKLDVSVVVGMPIVRILDRQQVTAPPGVVAERLVGGADLTPRRFEIDLGLYDPPLVNYIDDENQVSRPAFVLGAGQVEQFHVWAYARDNTWYDWTIELPLIVDGVRTTIDLLDGRGPLSTVGDNSDRA